MSKSSKLKILTEATTTSQSQSSKVGYCFNGSGTAPGSVVVIGKELKQLARDSALLEVQDLQAYWLSLMTDQEVSPKDKLTASKLYGQSIGAFERRTDTAINGGAVYGWRQNNPIEAEIVDEKAEK